MSNDIVAHKRIKLAQLLVTSPVLFFKPSVSF